MLKELIKDIKEFIKEEYKYLIYLLLIGIICFYPLDYYIVVGGGIDNIKSRVIVEDGYKSKGSFNLSYVTELDGTLLTYGLSYIVPKWERESIEDYKYDTKESVEDINFRNELSLEIASSNAIKNAYTLANKQVEEESKHMYVISVFNDDCNLKVGDELLKIDNKDILSFDFREYINNLEPNSVVKVTIKRNDKEMTVDTKLQRNEDKNVMGVYINTYIKYKADPKVEIKFKRSESGPSGGLMTTLSIYNQLVKEDITKGLTIAGTGTMESDGTVGEIGGIEYKVLGAEKGKADIFLSPKGENYKDAMKIVKKHKLKIKVIEVENIEDAITKLKELNK